MTSSKNKLGISGMQNAAGSVIVNEHLPTLTFDATGIRK